MSNPTRYDYDSDKFYYDEEHDTLHSYDESGQDYDGYGEPISNDD